MDNVVVNHDDWQASYNLSVNKGEWLSVVGPSGAGKTTLLQAISGLAEFTSGKIIINNQDVTNIVPAKRNISYMFQSNALFPFLSIYKNFCLCMHGFSFSDKQKREMMILELELCGLTSDFLERFPHEMSGGELARLNLCGVLLRNKPLILLDEPFASIGSDLRLELLRRLRKRQKAHEFTVLFVTHHISDAIYAGDRIVILEQGKIKAVKSPPDIRQFPDYESVANFLNFGSVIIFDEKKYFVLPEHLLTYKPHDFCYKKYIELNIKNYQTYLTNGVLQIEDLETSQIYQILPHTSFEGKLVFARQNAHNLLN